MTTDYSAIQALDAAIEDGDASRFFTLLAKDKSLLNAETPFGSWLHVASREGQIEIVRGLLARGADPNRQGGTFNGGALNLAASRGHLEVARCLIEHGAVMDVSEPERNPLFSAIYGGHRAGVALLIEHGIDVRVKYSGRSMRNMDAHAFALERGQLQIAAMLAHAELIATKTVHALWLTGLLSALGRSRHFRRF